MKNRNGTAIYIAAALAAGYAIRLFLMATTYFGDLGYIYGPPLIWTQHGLFNVYEHMTSFGWDVSHSKYYPPGLLFFSASATWLISLLFPSFPDWILLLKDGDIAAAMADRHRFIYLFLMKLPYLACDVLLVRLLLRMRDRIPPVYTIFFWVLNPFAVHAAYVVGQFDVAVALLICAALRYHYSGRRPAVSALLGLAAAIKVFPAIILFCHAAVSGRTAREKMWLMALGGLIPVLLTLPFLAGGNFTALQTYFVYPGVGSDSGNGFAGFLTRMGPVMAALAVILLRRNSYTDYLPRAVIALLFTFVLAVRFEDRYVLWAAAPLMIYAAGGGTPRLWSILLVSFSILSLFTYYGELVTQVFSPLAGGPVSAGWIPEYCARNGLPMPHKIFKTLMKIVMLVITMKILFGGGGAAAKPDRTGRMKKTAMGCLAALIMALLSISIIEAALWAVSKKNPSLVGLPEPECLVSEPGVEYRNKPDCGTPFFRINRDGFRGPEVGVDKKPGVFRIACLGDSYTASTTVNHQHSYPNRLRELMVMKTGGAEVINMGVSGYDTNLALQLYRAAGAKYKPDLVILGVFTGNDIYDNVRDLRYDVFQGVLTTWPTDRAKYLKKRVALGSGLYRLYKLRKVRMKAAGKLDGAQKTYNGFTEGYVNYHLETVMGVMSKKSLESEFWKRRWSATFGYLAELEEEARAGGAEFMVLIMPDEVQVNRAFFDTVLEKGGWRREDFDLTLPDSILMDHCREKGYHCVDLLPAFQAQPDGAALYEPNSGHWNAAGNLLAARRAAEYIEEHFYKR